ncbi:hypothetical protein SAMN07250955_104174 [Arboricoccus pini]|uniref:DUF6460 domain-containing protein n=1 Tax=Arboricoccus pini TaxID=1963835 RepID=A0A212QZ04_9PROT|nr:DUF6460 domain-containing protein [Arboricoccus pini]SNB64974.1 hypothetical protein SAMN07250955_104174 [Arboricoccus pini]
MPQITFRTVIKLLIWSLIVGAILSWLNVSPLGIVNAFIASIRDVARDFQVHAWNFGSYILLGAVIVVPLWALSYIVRATKR